MILLEAIFISIVILHRSCIWATLIPNISILITIVGTFIFLLSIVARRSYIKKNQDHIVVLLFISMLVILITALFSGTGHQVKSIVGYFAVTSVSVLIISSWNTRQEISALKIYLILCSIISILGIISWLIVNFSFIYLHYIDPAHLISLNEFTKGRMMGAEASDDWTNAFWIGREMFSFPYSFGLVLTGGYTNEFIGIPFFRASGIYHEPIANMFLIIPMIILTCNSIYFEKWPRRILLSIQFCYLFCSFSVAILISLLSVFMLHKMLVSLKNFPWINLTRSFRFVVMTITIGFLSYYVYNMIPTTEFAGNIISSKFASGKYKDAIVNAIFNPYNSFEYYFFLVVTLVCTWRSVKTNDKTSISYSLIMISFAIIALKGYFSQIFLSPAFFIFYFLMLKNHGRSFLPGYQLGISAREIQGGQHFPGEGVRVLFKKPVSPTIFSTVLNLAFFNSVKALPRKLLGSCLPLPGRNHQWAEVLKKKESLYLHHHRRENE